MHLCAIINLAFAGVAHLVERDLAKVEVASSSLVARSKKKHHPYGWCFFRVLRGARRRVSRLPPAGAVRQPGHFLETASLYPPQAAFRRFPRRPRAGDRKRKRNPTKVSLAHSPFLAVCRGADSRYSCHAAKAAWQLSFPGVLSPAGRALSAKPSAPETRSPGASAGSAASTALQDGPHSPYPVRTSARTCW